MEFPTLFPNGMTLPLQDKIRHVHLHEYDLHLIKYYDQRFGQHVYFRYYIYNLMMRHGSQQSTVVFIKNNLEDTLPLNLHGLKEYFQNTPSNELPNHIMRYAALFHSTRAFWRKTLERPYNNDRIVRHTYVVLYLKLNRYKMARPA